MHDDDDFAPDPRRITSRGGVIFNPWINISVSLALTIGLGWMTVWFWGMFTEVRDAPAHEDQGLDIVGCLIGVVVGALATIALFVVTIWVIVWWVRRSRRER